MHIQPGDFRASLDYSPTGNHCSLNSSIPYAHQYHSYICDWRIPLHVAVHTLLEDRDHQFWWFLLCMDGRHFVHSTQWAVDLVERYCRLHTWCIQEETPQRGYSCIQLTPWSRYVHIYVRRTCALKLWCSASIECAIHDNYVKEHADGVFITAHAYWPFSRESTFHSSLYPWHPKRARIERPT